MADNYSKLWLQRSVNQNAINRAAQAIQQTGRAFPCVVKAVNGSVVTVAFEMDTSPWVLPEITIPKAESPWIRMPTQVGDYGVTMPADAYLGAISGLGGGTANMTKPGNLSALVFVPVSNANSGPIDQNAAQIQGPNGFIGQTDDGNAQVIANGSSTTVKFGSSTIVLNGSSITMTAGGTTVTLSSGGFNINGINFGSHVHGGVQTGSGTTGGPEA